MWLKKLVGVVTVIALLGMNTLIVVGLVAPEKKQAAATEPAIVAVVPVPTVTLSATPTTIPAQTTSALSWSTTGNPTECSATGAWTGPKTPFGAESTGRIAAPGNYTYTLTCKNASGEASAATTVTVGNATPPKQTTVVSSTPKAGSSATYCGGRAPCYGPKEIAAKASAGNCWGYNVDRVINISGFNGGYHQAKSAISSIEVSGVCGKDLSGALKGSVSAEGQSWNHNQTTKINGDKNVSPYFVGYYDASK